MVTFFDDDQKKTLRSRLQRHINVLIWKSYLQRQRRWRILLAQTIFASILFLIAVYRAKPVFLTPLRAEPEPPLSTLDILNSLRSKNILGFAPNIDPYVGIMTRAADLLKREINGAATEDELNNNLYKQSQGKSISWPVIWIIWMPADGDLWKFSIRSTERARYETSMDMTSYANPHLRAGFLAVQLAISQAIVEFSASDTPEYEIRLIAMPVSPLMQEVKVKRALSSILLCFTLALIPPVLETVALVVHETLTRFKRALLIRGVEYSAMYVGWLVFALLTALPICLLGAITLILIFRWIHLVFALVLMLAYIWVMIVLALIMAMFHNKAWIACVWTILFTLLQTYLAELLAHHDYDKKHDALTFMLNLILPPLGLVHAFNQFALLQTGRENMEGVAAYQSPLYTLGSWSVLILIYFLILMLLQRTISQDRAIGGQVSWRSIIFKKATDVNQLHAIETPTGQERERLQEVDELVAKAISFRDVSKCLISTLLKETEELRPNFITYLKDYYDDKKAWDLLHGSMFVALILYGIGRERTGSIMGVPILSNITLDIYRGEFTMLFGERIQEKMIITIEDLLTGLTHPDKGSINVLGHVMKPKRNYMTKSHMMGYCHRSAFLIDDLTVQEHFTLFFNVCLWSESAQYIAEYSDIRSRSLVTECDLDVVRNERIRDLDVYYRAQLCWAIAIMLEPKVIIMPNLADTTGYVTVIKDKIMKYKKYITIVKICFSSIQLEYADRVFLFDSKILTFGGTPAYMFFKYGREYRVRMTLRTDATLDDESTAELLSVAAAAGASIRAHLGSLLILRLPASPTDNAATLIMDLTNNANKYGLTSLNISVPDSEEVSRRAITEARAATYETPASYQLSKDALKRISEPVVWTRKLTIFSNITHLRYIGWKYFAFYIHYRFFFMITVFSALAAGLMIGFSLAFMLDDSERDNAAKKLLHGELLTVEYADKKTTLVIRIDNSTAAKSLANAYVLSEPNATEKQVAKITYTAIVRPKSLTEYLVTRAIDSPQQYVYLYAYGLDVYTNKNDTLVVQAIYSPLHYDYGAAARSMARSYTALLRYYTGNFEASIQVTDDPLALDLTPWMRYATRPPLLIQFLLILSISHITLIPSKEHGLVRHMQSHAMNFSPARYWFTLYFCDLILYWILVVLMTIMMMLIMYMLAPVNHFHYMDLLVVPFLLVIYGVGCIPQAYIFSLGPRVALNSMTFVIVNVVFGETTIIAKIFYGDTLDYALLLMSLSPQFNMAYALVKIKQVFLYNSECLIFKSKNLCSAKTLHKCCQKCGVLQKCFYKKQYLTRISNQVIALTTTGTVFMVVLFLIEYQVIQRMWQLLVAKWITVKKQDTETLMPGAAKEKKSVLDKRQQAKIRHSGKVNNFGEYLIAQNLTKKDMGTYSVHSVYLGLGKGEALALSGLKRHGRLQLCEMLAGCRMASEGHVWCMSKWKQETQPHMYARQISFSCEHKTLPGWMSVYDALEMIALLRGVPRKHVKSELRNHIEALELQDQADTLVCRMSPHDRTRLHFAAAVVGAPPVIILDECTAYQKFSVRRAMYFILYHMRQRGHAVFMSSSNVESHMPVTNRLAILLDGRIYDIDTVDNLVARYSAKGYTVVVHLKDEVNVTRIFARYFRKFVINDTSEVLVNVQVLDSDLTWATIFQKMEMLKKQNQQVYSYIVTVIAIDYIYNSILLHESGRKPSGDFVAGFRNQASRVRFKPSQEKLDELMPFKQKYDITKLKELPWSVIFHT